MFSTKHTHAVNENVFQHLWFCIKVSAKLQLAILCFMLHGLSGDYGVHLDACKLKQYLNGFLI